MMAKDYQRVLDTFITIMDMLLAIAKGTKKLSKLLSKKINKKTT